MNAFVARHFINGLYYFGIVFATWAFTLAVLVWMNDTTSELPAWFLASFIAMGGAGWIIAVLCLHILYPSEAR